MEVSAAGAAGGEAEAAQSKNGCSETRDTRLDPGESGRGEGGTGIYAGEGEGGAPAGRPRGGLAGPRPG